MYTVRSIFYQREFQLQLLKNSKMNEKFTYIYRQNIKGIHFKGSVYFFHNKKRLTHGLHTLVLCIRRYNPNTFHPQCHSGFPGNFADTVRNNCLRISLVLNTLNTIYLKSMFTFRFQSHKIKQFFLLT